MLHVVLLDATITIPKKVAKLIHNDQSKPRRDPKTGEEDISARTGRPRVSRYLQRPMDLSDYGAVKKVDVEHSVTTPTGKAVTRKKTMSDAAYQIWKKTDAASGHKVVERRKEYAYGEPEHHGKDFTQGEHKLSELPADVVATLGSYKQHPGLSFLAEARNRENTAKAIKVHRGTPAEDLLPELTAPKPRRFVRNLRGGTWEGAIPESDLNEATIDRHAATAGGWKPSKTSDDPDKDPTEIEFRGMPQKSPEVIKGRGPVQLTAKEATLAPYLVNQHAWRLEGRARGILPKEAQSAGWEVERKSKIAARSRRFSEIQGT